MTSRPLAEAVPLQNRPQYCLHVEKAQTGNMILIQQPLVDILPVKLLNLCCAHLATIRCQITVSLGTHLKQGLVRSCGKERGKELFFSHSEPSLEVFHLHRCVHRQRLRKAVQSRSRFLRQRLCCG